MQSENLVYLRNEYVEADGESRLKLAVKALELGGDVQRVSDALGWREFEAMAAVALEANGYSVKKNLHFKADGKRWEIDVVGCKKPLVLCVDCKQWHHGMHPATLSKVASLQSKRAEALADSMPASARELECAKWSQATFVPIILSLVPFSPKFISGVPIVPVLSLQDFVHHLPLNVDCVRQFGRKISHL